MGCKIRVRSYRLYPITVLLVFRALRRIIAGEVRDRMIVRKFIADSVMKRTCRRALF